MNDRQLKWDLRFLRLARFISTWSKDPRTQVGAVLTDSHQRIISLGYNGLPQGVLDDPTILHEHASKWAFMIHGEENAILFAQRPLLGSTLYTYPCISCSRCASKVAQVGIARVVTHQHPRAAEWLEQTAWIFTQAGIEISYVPTPQEMIDPTA